MRVLRGARCGSSARRDLRGGHRANGVPTSIAKKNMLLANVIFPAFSAPYFSQLFFPVAGIAAILTEVFVFRKVYSSLSFYKTLGFVLIANIVSWIAGIILSNFLPSGLAPRVIQAGEKEVSILGRGDDFGTLVIVAFFVALVLSILIEYPVWRFFGRKLDFPRLLRTVCIAHVASYTVLVITLVLHALVMS